jgi:DNA-binding CsgD family transcriptional regulator
MFLPGVAASCYESRQENSMSHPDQTSLEALASLALTPRETEVLFWISQGKSNHDIGVILGAKTGTICKHVEHIFGKLNVENRTAAAVIALEMYRSGAPASEGNSGQPWGAIAGLITAQLSELWSGKGQIFGEIARLIA